MMITVLAVLAARKTWNSHAKTALIIDIHPNWQFQVSNNMITALRETSGTNMM